MHWIHISTSNHIPPHQLARRIFLIIHDLNIRPHTHSQKAPSEVIKHVVGRSDPASVYEQMLIFVKLQSPLAGVTREESSRWTSELVGMAMVYRRKRPTAPPRLSASLPVRWMVRVQRECISNSRAKQECTSKKHSYFSSTSSNEKMDDQKWASRCYNRMNEATCWSAADVFMFFFFFPIRFLWLFKDVVLY